MHMYSLILFILLGFCFATFVFELCGGPYFSWFSSFYFLSFSNGLKQCQRWMIHCYRDVKNKTQILGMSGSREHSRVMQFFVRPSYPPLPWPNVIFWWPFAQKDGINFIAFSVKQGVKYEGGSFLICWKVRCFLDHFLWQHSDSCSLAAIFRIESSSRTCKTI